MSRRIKRSEIFGKICVKNKGLDLVTMRKTFEIIGTVAAVSGDHCHAQ